MNSFVRPLSSRYIFILGLIIFLLVVISAFIVWVYKLKTPEISQVKDAGSSLYFEDIHAFTTFETGHDELELRTKMKNHLNSYGWINKDKGIVHIPIQNAIEKFLKKEAHEK